MHDISQAQGLSQTDDGLRALVERTLSGKFRLLNFPRPLEQRFETDTGGARSRELVVTSLIGLAMFNAFLLVDWSLMPDSFDLAMIFRLAIVTPLAIVTIAITWRNPAPWVREGIQAGICLTAATIPTLLIFFSTDPLRVSAHHGLILVVLFANMVQKIRFWYAVPTVLGMQGIYTFTLWTLIELDPKLVLAFNMVFAGAVIFSLVAGYNLEREKRKTYLLGLREALRNDQLQAISRRDPLTGLGNRRALEDSFIAHMARTRDGGTHGLAVMLLDIDHFKAYNDTIGHQAGDRCLVEIARIIQAQLPHAGAEAYRYGGEEFLILLDMCDLRTAQHLAGDLRFAIEAAGIAHPALPGRAVTASFGVAATLIGAAVDPHELVAAADAALYAAKRDGRNRVWPPLPGTVTGLRVPAQALRA